MAAHVAGDAAAFDLLFSRYASPLYRLIRRRVASDEDTRDLLQQTLLHLHRARHDFRPDGRLRSWLFTIAINVVREHHRRRARRPEQLLEPEAVVPDGKDPHASERQRERAARVRAALDSLPEQQREVIELHWFAESPYEEIAAIVGASVPAVRVRAHRGYERLRELLRDRE